MPYPAGHRTTVKKKIIDSARKLFNRHGFENVSLTQIMAGAGLTHGGFYSYFKAKSDLYAEVLQCFFTDPEWKSCWEGVHVDLSSSDVGPQVVRAYLSRHHFEDIENSCPMVALPTDVARSGRSARLAFETVFRAIVSVLERSLTQQGHRRRATAQGIAALAIGGMIVARTMVDRTLADQLFCRFGHGGKGGKEEGADRADNHGCNWRANSPLSADNLRYCREQCLRAVFADAL